MNQDTVLEVSGLSKKFCRSLKRSMYYGAVDVMKAIFTASSTKAPVLRAGEFWALDDVSFSVRKGETFGILGLNGSGKSTLLRLISGIFPPDKGEIAYKGKLGSLIALGAGFHPHMTARENIFLNGTILGMTREELEQKFEDIVQFSELGAFLDSPISTFSSGMVVRLGFAIAIHSNLDIMLIDEVLSVGDVSFQNKCLRKIYEKKQEGVAFLFVSHAIETVRLVCDRGLLLNGGQKVELGDIDQVLMSYNRIVRGSKATSLKAEIEDNYSIRSDSTEFIDMGLTNSRGEKVRTIPYGEDFCVYWEFLPKKDLEDACIGVGIKDDRAFNIVYAFSEDYREVHIPRLKKGRRYKVEVLFKKPNVKPGVYGFNCVIASNKTAELFIQAYSSKKTSFRIESPQRVFTVEGDFYTNNSVVELPTEWSVQEVTTMPEIRI